MNMAARIELLEEENRQLRAVISAPPDLKLPAVWNLTPSEAAVLLSLYSAPDGFRRSDALHVASNLRGRETDPEIIRVLMSKVRRKVAAFGIEIVARWGSGYQMHAQSRSIISEAMQ